MKSLLKIKLNFLYLIFQAFLMGIPNHLKESDYKMQYILSNLRQADFIDENLHARFFSRASTGNFEVFRIDFKPVKLCKILDQGFVRFFRKYFLNF